MICKQACFKQLTLLLICIKDLDNKRLEVDGVSSGYLCPRPLVPALSIMLHSYGYQRLAPGRFIIFST